MDIWYCIYCDDDLLSLSNITASLYLGSDKKCREWQQSPRSRQCHSKETCTPESGQWNQCRGRAWNKSLSIFSMYYSYQLVSKPCLLLLCIHQATDSTRSRKTPKKKAKLAPTTYHCCRKARVKDSTCNAVICDTCMCKWRDNGVQKEEEPSLEEKQARELERRTGGSTSMSLGNRRSRRNEDSTMSDKQNTVYEVDKNGCRHDDPNFWQSESNPTYFNPIYRQNVISKNKQHRLLSENCHLCSGPVFSLPA